MKAINLPRIARECVSAVTVYGASARGRGAFHKKVVVVDKRTLYMGSANCTTNSRCNEEVVVRMTGPPVMQALDGLRSARDASELMGA